MTISVGDFNDALKKSDLNGTDEFIINDSGTIYTVTFNDISSAIGVTGTLTGADGGNASPILDANGTDYTIRGIVGGNGISSQLNAFGSITLNANLNNSGVSSDGEKILANITGEQLNFKRILGGNGIDITATANSVVINSAESTTTGNTVIVSTLEDFPTPINGVISLASNTDYVVVSDISTSNRFSMGADATLRAQDFNAGSITYTGFGSMFTFANGAQTIKHIELNCPNGLLFDTTGNTTGNLLVRYIRSTGIKDLGIIEKPFCGLYDWLIESHTGDGFICQNIVAGRLRIINLNFVEVTFPTMTMIDLGTCTFDSLDIDAFPILSSASGQTFMKGQTGGANITANATAFINKVNIQGDMVMLNTLADGDSGYVYSNCNKIDDTDPHILIHLGSTVDTTISTIDTPVKVNGTFIVDESQVMTSTSDGTISYIGRKSTFRRIDMGFTARPTSGTKTYTFYVAINGSVIESSGVSREISAGAIGAIPLTWAVTLAEGDTVEMFVENNTDTQNIQFQKLVMRVA